MELYDTLLILGWITAAFAVIFLIVSISMYFGFDVRNLRRNLSGGLEQEQIEEIRRNSVEAANNRGKVNVFEELEKKAKVKKNNTHSLNVGPTTGIPTAKKNQEGTSLLNQGVKPVNPNFIIEKNIMFVSTNEVM